MSIFISFEGGEGSGKSTQLQLLCGAFSTANLPYIKTREPGGTEGAERIRSLLVTGEKDAWLPISETLLFYAARVEHVDRLIKPALSAGKTVLADRFADSTRVYQGLGKNVPDAFLSDLHRLTLGSFMPDLTIILDIDPEIGLKRAKSRAGHETRFESMELAFHQKIRAGFLAIAKKESERCVVLDAAASPEALHSKVIETIVSKTGFALTSAHA